MPVGVGGSMLGVGLLVVVVVEEERTVAMRGRKRMRERSVQAGSV